MRPGVILLPPGGWEGIEPHGELPVVQRATREEQPTAGRDLCFDLSIGSDGIGLKTLDYLSAFIKSYLSYNIGTLFVNNLQIYYICVCRKPRWLMTLHIAKVFFACPVGNLDNFQN